jgi:formate-dependent nitrite reductase membrane component NrfD
MAGDLQRSSGARKTSEETWSVAEVASLADVAAILAEGAWVYLFLTSLAVGGIGQQLVYRLVISGDLSPWFWWGFVAPGLAAPLLGSVIIEIAERILHTRVSWLLYLKFVLVLIGGLVLRYVVVWGGDLKTPLPFPPSMWPIPGLGGPLIPGLGG